MRKVKRELSKHPSGTIEKCPTGIRGFDEITGGGLPRGRPTLISGRAGSGKTLFGIEFIARGARLFGENGVVMTFEETGKELIANFASLGFDLSLLVKQKKILFDYVSVERGEIEETGAYDLDGIFARLDYAIKEVNAKRVFLDTIEALFSGLSNEGILRAELRRLFHWLKTKGVTAVITGERGEKLFTRHGLEEYVADCVILLDHAVEEHIATRRLRIVKYRGSAHGTDDFPFLIDEGGISVMPVTSLALKHHASNETISSGIPRLDTMLGAQGFYRGSSILVSGTPGSGKSTLAAHFALHTCRQGKKALYFAFEESESQIVRNMRSIGIDLAPCLKNGSLKITALRPTAFGLEMHLATMHKEIVAFKPDVIIIDPISNLITVGSEAEVKSMLVRLIDFIKAGGITAFFTDLIIGDFRDSSGTGVSSLMDTWIFLRDTEYNGERNRVIYVLKARGFGHSNQVREFRITSKGIQIIDVYTGPSGVLTGTARIMQEAKDNADRLLRRQEIARKQGELDRKRQALDAQIVLLQTQYKSDEEEFRKAKKAAESFERAIIDDRRHLARLRFADEANGRPSSTPAKEF